MSKTIFYEITAAGFNGNTVYYCTDGDTRTAATIVSDSQVRYEDEEEAGGALRAA